MALRYEEHVFHCSAKLTSTQRSTPDHSTIRLCDTSISISLLALPCEGRSRELPLLCTRYLAAYSPLDTHRLRCPPSFGGSIRSLETAWKRKEGLAICLDHTIGIYIRSGN